MRPSHSRWDFEAVEAHLIRGRAGADFSGNELPAVAPHAEPNRITAVRARKRLDFGHVFRRSVDEAEVLAGDKIVPKPVAILVELRGVPEMRVARSAASELFSLGNRHPVAVEVMGLDAPGERQGEGKDGGARYSSLPRVSWTRDFASRQRGRALTCPPMIHIAVTAAAFDAVTGESYSDVILRLAEALAPPTGNVGGANAISDPQWRRPSANGGLPMGRQRWTSVVKGVLL
jgi:hypothetical protein